ncbi:hypothetical protein [Polaromonas sp.]|jgi:hypothetical protein|uniref:hypothetical protein n=1 Tax=Polaromonas sp. TaxID=1869339 RepID=UPI001DD9D1D5|nr:hypothetical protein [Polaromonas sp.]MBT9477461.1 hypothetical protein [Polaromonas sp.]
MNSWNPVLGAAWWWLTGLAHGLTQAACALSRNVDFHRSRACIFFVYAFPIFKTAQAAQSKFRKLSTLGYTNLSMNRQIFFKTSITGIA